MSTAKHENSFAFKVGTRLIQWHTDQGRELPWRMIEQSDPYRVWLAEIMLQQTTYATVQNRFEAFLQAFPNIEVLANSQEETVLQHWAGLGYYARARNLLKCAQTIVHQHNGVWPKAEDELRRLPGIGAYTAAAISAIAFDLPSVAVDANVKRIFARLTCYQQPVSDTLGALIKFYQESAQNHSPKTHLEAWMDFGEIQCKARQPDCLSCPMNDLCLGKEYVKTLPITAPKKPRRTLFALAYWLEFNNHVWLYRKKSSGLLGGMLSLPMSDWEAQKPEVPTHFQGHHLGKPVRHLFTHIDLKVQLYKPKVKDEKSLEEMLNFLNILGTSYSKDVLLHPENTLGVPTLIKKLLSRQRNFDK